MQSPDSVAMAASPDESVFRLVTSDLCVDLAGQHDRSPEAFFRVTTRTSPTCVSGCS